MIQSDSSRETIMQTMEQVVWRQHQRQYESGNKESARERVTADSIDMTVEYRDWHRTLNRSWYVNDVDQIEWRSGPDGQPFPVALIELTEIRKISDLSAVLDRFLNKTAQGDFSKRIAELLGVNAYIVGYVAGLSEFHVYNLTENKGWVKWSKPMYEQWLRSLSVGNIKKMQASRGVRLR
tara:strand:- start:3949 stop:4488 length:540 start_codon:yes stop_codon:yes gene_type:complete